MGNGRRCRDVIELNDGESILVEFCSFFFFLVLLLVEIEQYAYEPLFEHESGSDEGESDEENHLRKTEWCQCNLSPEESTIVVLSWMRCTINCKVDSFNQLYVKTREL